MTDNLRGKWFAMLEFQLHADTPNKLFAADDTEHYIVYGHNRADCKAIKEKRRIAGTSLSEYLADNEYFDGELTFSDPWPCSTCIPTETLPPVERNRDVPKNEHRWMEPRTAVSNPPSAPAPTATQPSSTGNPDSPRMSTEGQVRKLMALYRKQKPNESKAVYKAAEDRAKAMTFAQASAVINKQEKAEKAQPEQPAPHRDGSGPSQMTKGAKVLKNGHPGTIFWVGVGKNGAPRYGVEFIDQNGNKQREFASSGWTLA
jgi:type IV secretory pathway VirB10-like protein